jgi:GntR family transcriptional regulator
MDIIISNSSQTPIYLQIKEQIKNKIITGELKAGDLLPSIRNLARDLRVSVITTKSAYDELEKEGFLETRPGRGCFVANKNRELVKEEQLKRVEKLIEEAVNMAKLTKITKQEIQQMVTLFYDEEES